MRLSEWRTGAPVPDAMSQKVLSVIEPVLAALGGEPDPHCWVAWGDDPGLRYIVLAVTPAGLAQCHVRVNVPGEGPRASGKLVRWNRATIGELSAETHGAHRIVSAQVEGQVLRGTDAESNRIAAFVLSCLAAIDGRGGSPTPEV